MYYSKVEMNDIQTTGFDLIPISVVALESNHPRNDFFMWIRDIQAIIFDLVGTHDGYVIKSNGLKI